MAHIQTGESEWRKRCRRRSWVCTARIIYGTAVFETGIIAVTVKDRSNLRAFATDGVHIFMWHGMADRNF